jgi:hypothetical protein
VASFSTARHFLLSLVPFGLHDADNVVPNPESMKLKTRSILVLLAVVAALISGCATTGSGGGYQLKQTRQDVDWAMVRYHNRVSFGFLTPQEQQRVSDAYKTYQTAFNAALQQANGNPTNPTPANVKQLADQLFSVLDSIP